MRLPSFAYILIVIGLAVASLFANQSLPLKYGLDIQGGTRLTYRMDFEKLEETQKANLGVIRKNTIDTLTRRVASALGVVEASVYLKGTDQVIIELPGETNIEKAREILGSSASIEYYHATNVATDRAAIRRYAVDEVKDFKGTSAVYFRERNDPTKVIEPLSPQYREMINGWKLILKGGDLAQATVIPNRGQYAPQMIFSKDGAKKMEDWSRRYMNDEENLAAVLDGIVLSIAPLKKGTILRDNAFIDSTEDMATVKRLTDLLNSGALPVDLEELGAVVVDPTIGKSALGQIIQAGLISLAITATFVVVYYLFPGFVAVLALALYTLLTITVLKLLGATFSLASIAGIILSVGMAVDANILIFERVKEELKNGKSLQSAIDLGFRRALPAIIDSNACTILTSFVLMMIGTGPVKGFGSTLVIGVLISFFTAVTATRWILSFFVSSGIATNPKLFAMNRSWFGEHLEHSADERQLKIVEKRNVYFIISVLTIIPGIIFYMLGGLKPNAEFLGGYEAVYKVTSQTTETLAKSLEEAGLKGFNTKFADTGTERQVYVTVPPSGSLAGKSPEEVEQIVIKAAGASEADKRGFTNVGPTVQKEAIDGAIRGVLLSTGLIIIYLGFRFGFALGGFNVGLRFSFAAVGALLHDLFVVAGLAAVFGYLLGWELSALFVTAMLTVVGFSTHDTIVIFDRIRENLQKPLPGEDIARLINRSITQSLARSINTSATVIVTLCILIALGSATPDLRFFNVVMLIGIISGTYSSIFNASPILYLVDKFIEKRAGSEHTLLGIARKEVAQRGIVATVAPSDAEPMQSQAYGQVKRRRASDRERSERNIDEP